MYLVSGTCVHNLDSSANLSSVKKISMYKEQKSIYDVTIYTSDYGCVHRMTSLPVALPYQC